jgi:outer membrane protein OmpA-like peptidoglycan-associated protein
MRVLILLLIACFTGCIGIAYGQVKDPKKAAGEEAEDRTNQQIDDQIDKGFDKLEKGIGNLFGKKKKKKQKEDEGEQQMSESTGEPVESGETVVGEDASTPLKPWSKYDFVPGEMVIFEDNLEGERNGEFPSQWDLIDGYVENAIFGEEIVIRFTHDNSGATITPLMTKEGDYLPEKFTIEMDVYLSHRTTKYYIEWWDKRQHQPEITKGISKVDFGYEQGASYDGGRISRSLEESDKKPYPHWRHIAISFNKRALKLYLDQHRLLNVPNVTGNPTGISLHASTYDYGNTGNYPTLIKNIRIAEGAVDLYDRVFTDGKIITNGIRFDVNKATLRPESMGVINSIFNLMEQHPDLKFSVEGHTDSDGETEFNQQLSEQRAETVKNKLVELGITPDRLSTKGFGETIPVSDNTTPEGKANNRRVEFVKM